MFTNRQVSLIQMLAFEDKETFLTTEQMAKKMHLSPRTIQTEMATIRKELRKVQFLELESVRGKGYRLTVYDAEQFLAYLKSACDEGELNSRESRVRRIVALLFEGRRPISSTQLAGKLYISQSTLAADIREAKKLLKKYDINILTTSRDGISVVGKEIDIRTCIFKEGICAESSHGQTGEDENIRVIGHFLVDIFMDYKYSVSDVALQNLVLHFSIVLRRYQEGFRLTEGIEIDEGKYQLEIRMAREFFTKMKNYYGIAFPDVEILYAAICFRGKRDYYEDAYITEEIDSFVQETLESIREDYGLDFLCDMQLRVSLSLHLVPLLSRARYNGQLENDLLTVIRQKFLLSFDIAPAFAFSITSHYGYFLKEGEIAYLALYFEIALNDYRRRKPGKKVLIVSNLKRSQTLLLKDRIHNWFADQINELDVYDSLGVKTADLEDYDLILTTVKEYHTMNERAVLIHRYPGEEDRRRIKMNFDGFDGVDGFISFFRKENFLVTDCCGKEDILKKLCACSGKETQLYSESCQRENVGETYFGHGIAVPHPLHPVETETTIYVAVLQHSIAWNNEENQVKAIFLVSMQKDNLASMNVWAYLSELINHPDFGEDVAKITDYEEFIRLLRRNLRNVLFEDQDDFLI